MDKQESDRLIEKAKLCLRSGRREKALQLLYEAQKIFPSTRARGKGPVMAVLLALLANLNVKIESATSVSCECELHNVCSNQRMCYACHLNIYNMVRLIIINIFR